MNATIPLYRSGHITPRHEVTNEQSEIFDALAIKLTGKSPNRSGSVYAGITAHSISSFWVEYREGSGLDADIYKITIPDMTDLNQVYAYDVLLFEGWEYANNIGDMEVAETCLKKYMNTRIPMSEWESRLLWMPETETQDIEVLIPYSVAENSCWDVLNK